MSQYLSNKSIYIFFFLLHIGSVLAYNIIVSLKVVCFYSSVPYSVVTTVIEMGCAGQ
jgi:hypothetical protein